jgi:GNAT superfamily N-acetyltransferase
MFTSSLARKARTAVTYGQRHGGGAVFRHYAGNALYALGLLRAGSCYALDDYAILMAAPRVAGFDVRLLTHEEIANFAATGEPRFELAEIGPLLARGDMCFGGFVDGELACSGWYALEPIPQFGVVLGFAPNAVWEHRLYTRPAYRGRALQVALKAAAARWCRERGRAVILNSIEWTNDASKSLHRRLGYRRIATIVRIGTESTGRTFVLGANAFGVHVVKKAESA